MLYELIILLLLLLTGIGILNIIKNNWDFLKLLIVSIPVGIVYHTFIFTLCIIFMIPYNKIVFIILSFLPLISFIFRKININFDKKNLPTMYYVVFAGFIFLRLFIIIRSSFVEFYNFDELSQYLSNTAYAFKFNDYSFLSSLYAPVNYFLAWIDYSFRGINMFGPRLFSLCIYFIISLYIFQSLISCKVNRHIACLLSMLFLVCSGEYLVLVRTFYTNIFFMCFFIISTIEFVKYYIIKNKSGISYLNLFTLLGCAFSRSDGAYFVIVYTLICSIVLFIKKRVTVKQIAVFNIYTWYKLFITIVNFLFNVYADSLSEYTSDNIVERVLLRFKWEYLSKFLKSAYEQFIGDSYYYFNRMVVIIIALFLIIFIVKCFSKNYNKNYIKAIFTLLIFQVIYIIIMLGGQWVLFKHFEFIQAASLSRYIIPVLLVNLVSLGWLFRNEEVKDD